MIGHRGRFTRSEEDLERIQRGPSTAQTSSPSYRLAFADDELMVREELRAVRLQLELMKTELVQRDFGIEDTVVVFGSTRIPEPALAARQYAEVRESAQAAPEDGTLQREAEIAERILAKSQLYDEARRFTGLVTAYAQRHQRSELAIITGGGPGIMEAANRGAFEAGGRSIGLNIVLPMEQYPNPYITPELCFQFHYFAVRKMHFLLRARALVAFPGGYGTMDELFEALTLLQTGKIEPLPILLFGRAFWQRIIDFDAMVEEGVISERDLRLFQFVDSAEQAWEEIRAFNDW